MSISAGLVGVMLPVLVTVTRIEAGVWAPASVALGRFFATSVSEKRMKGAATETLGPIGAVATWWNESIVCASSVYVPLTRLAGNALTFSVNIPARLGAIDRDFVAETMSAVEALITPLGCTA